MTIQKAIPLPFKKENPIEKVGTLLIASGGGTDADSIMTKHYQGYFKYAYVLALLSTKRDQLCLDKARALDIPAYTIDRRDYDSDYAFNVAVEELARSLQIELIYLVGCIRKIFPINGVSTNNIHPAEPDRFGGNGIYGLEPHKRVLADIVDTILRGKKSLDDKFYTYPTVHVADMGYDSGDKFMQMAVQVPTDIIEACLKYNMINGIPDAYAERLQKHVLPYEWIMLPAAVEASALQIINMRTL